MLEQLLKNYEKETNNMLNVNTKKWINFLFLLGCFLCVAAETLSEELNSSSIMSRSAVLMDAKTGQILFEKNMNDKAYPASTTKIMTGLLALEKGSLDDVVTMSRDAVFRIERGSSNIALDTDEQILLKDLIYALAIRSANDAANGIAEHIAGTYEGFIDLMNKRAKELGANNTHFVNPNGLYSDDHYSTAYDMALILRQGIQTPGFLEFFNKRNYTIPPTNLKDEERVLYNANSLLMGRYGDVGLIASKTGYTVKTKHTLVTAAQKGNRVLIAVALNSDHPKDKYYDTKKLLEYGFSEFNEVKIDNNFLSKSLEFSNNKEDIERALKDNPLDKIFLLHNSFTSNDIEVQYESLENNKFNISLFLNNHSNLMYKDIGKIILDVPNKNSKGFEAFKVYLGEKSFSSKLEIVLKITIALFMFIFLILALRIVYKIVNDEV